MGGQGTGQRSRRQSRDAHPELISEQHLDEVLRALAHPARRALVRACVSRDQPAGELVELTGLAAASVSEHLKVLRKTGLMVVDIRGRWRFYRTDPAVVRAAADALGVLSGR